jgi:hypothetical protein
MKSAARSPLCKGFSPSNTLISDTGLHQSTNRPFQSTSTRTQLPDPTRSNDIPRYLRPSHEAQGTASVCSATHLQTMMMIEVVKGETAYGHRQRTTAHIGESLIRRPNAPPVSRLTSNLHSRGTSPHERPSFLLGALISVQ